MQFVPMLKKAFIKALSHIQLMMPQSGGASRTAATSDRNVLFLFFCFLASDRNNACWATVTAKAVERINLVTVVPVQSDALALAGMFAMSLQPTATAMCGVNAISFLRPPSKHVCIFSAKDLMNFVHACCLNSMLNLHMAEALA